MHLSIVNNHAHIAGIASGKGTLFHTLHDTLQNCRHEACINGSTYHTIDEYQLATPFKINLFFALGIDAVFLTTETIDVGIGHSLIIRLNDKVHFSKLSGTTRLFLVTVICACRLGNGLAIRNLGFVKDNLNLVIVFHTPFQGTQVEFTLSVNDNLLQLLALFNLPCGILLTHLLQGIHHLLGLLLVYGTNGTAILGIGILDEVETVLAILSIQRISGLHILQLNGTSDVTCHKFFHLDTVCTGTAEQLSHTFLATTVCVSQISTFMNGTTHHLEVLYFSDVGFHGGLEEEQAGRSVGIGCNFFATGIEYLGHFINEGNHITQEFHQTTHTHILTCTYAEYGEHSS